ncbi:hypothetical protein Cfor_12600 [Coptotermes formosanus]|uniref:Peptidase M13 N-terminal domain-containing protein n=1 Tax=Coptotermes formosanus TaxID=36987 RepID=A0A6L2Q962_COPFO|nr:hypothetical protein Cfor_12600 [Coptotermes formosanus]
MLAITRSLSLGVKIGKLNGNVNPDDLKAQWHLRFGREEAEWQQKRKIRLLLSTSFLVLLSVGLILGAISHLCTKKKIDTHAHSHKNNESSIHVNQFPYDPEGKQPEDRDLMQDVQTKFVPPAAPYPMVRQKRSTAYTLETYQGNNKEYQILYEAENDNRVAASYPDEETDADYEMDGTHYSHEDRDVSIVNNDPIVVKDDHDLPWKSSGENVNTDHHLQVEEEQQKSHGLEHKDWLALQGNATSEKPDFYNFWKGDGDYHTIRHAQAKMMSSYMDVTADPCQDFYQYACGNWGKKNPIPKDKTAYDTFEMLRENLDDVLRKLLEEQSNAKCDSTSEIWQNDAILKAKYFFQSCMNYEILEKRAEKPLLDLLDQLGGWPVLQHDWDSSQFDWVLLMAQLRLYNNDILISEWVGPDIKNSDEYIIQFDQTSLGLPSRDYYLQPSYVHYLEAYKNYLIKIAILLGAPLGDATHQAEELINFEIRLARITSGPEQRRNVSELYQKMSIGELRQVIPQIDWAQYLTLVLARPVSTSEPVVVFALNYIQDLVTLLSKTPSRTIANYLMWRFVRHRANNLDDRFQEAKQQFYYVLFGREQAPPRWKNCIVEVNNHLGMAVGAMFVRKYFDEYSKNDTVQMTEEIMQSFRELLTKTEWIDRETKELAVQKLDAMKLRIGYPDFILDPQLLNQRYKDLVIRPNQFFENTLNILQHVTRMEQDNLGTPVNKSLWNAVPAVVNAYYSRNKNQINQYSHYTVHEVAMHIDGISTQGENIADNGGIKQAYRAYQRWVNANADFSETLPGINATGHQLFFLNFAQIWCGTMRPETARNNLKTGVHSPGKFRVIGTLSNSEDFASVFKCQLGTPMNPVKKCSLLVQGHQGHLFSTVSSVCTGDANGSGDCGSETSIDEWSPDSTTASQEISTHTQCFNVQISGHGAISLNCSSIRISTASYS